MINAGDSIPSRFAPGFLALLCILGIAAALRLYGIGVNLPNYPAPDEPQIVERAFAVGGGDLNPHFFDWPGNLLIYANTGVFATYYVTGRVAGWFESVGDFRQEFRDDPTNFYVLARLLNVAAALATIALVFRAVAGWGLLASATAGLLISVSPIHVGESSVAYTDVPATLLLASSLLTLRSFHHRPTGTSFLVAGLLVGLGAAVKYYVVSGTVGIACAAMLSPVPLKQRVRLLSLGAAGSLFGFVIGCPFSVLAFDEFSRDLLREMAHQREGHIGFDQAANPIWGYVGNSLTPAIGVPALGAAVWGIWLAMRHHREFLPLVVTTFGYLVLTTSTNVSFPRYAIPHVVLLAVLVGIAMGRLRSLPTVASVVAVVILAGPAMRAVGVMAQRAMKDTRVVAEQWLEAHVPATARVLASDDGPRYPASLRISRFRPVSDKQLALVHADQVDVFVLTWSTTSLMQDESVARAYPQVASSHQALYQWVKTHARLTGVFLPDDQHQGPSIEVYMTTGGPPPPESR